MSLIFLSHFYTLQKTKYFLFPQIVLCPCLIIDVFFYFSHIVGFPL